MDDITIIQTFIKLLTERRSIFPPEAFQDLPQLDKTLDQCTNEQLEPVAEAILAWCEQYEAVGEAMLTYKLRKDLTDIEPTEPENERMIKDNIFILK